MEYENTHYAAAYDIIYCLNPCFNGIRKYTKDNTAKPTPNVS